MQIFLADGRDGTNEPTEGSTRGPRGPKNVCEATWVKALAINAIYFPPALSPCGPLMPSTTCNHSPLPATKS